jgi:flagellar protein FlbD
MPVIRVTRLNGSELMLNAILIETVEETPDTIITLTTGKKFVVRESAADVVSSVRSYMRQIGAFPLSVKSHDLEDIR